ncbi:pollen-specific leucine-rich repeat extensin-like protein 1 [Drosophila eugracilis]|uniref:pollen-specific leucine-rich repeat extensin-like protein 1 n=1 Tax=Drosophila eugracilis TaxID=29029 RepID=UPI0007E764BA|nr:pollen-specific leucine-rich repeat extensin-like protein 1 [Drosophila eugracilis]
MPHKKFPRMSQAQLKLLIKNQNQNLEKPTTILEPPKFIQQPLKKKKWPKTEASITPGPAGREELQHEPLQQEELQQEPLQHEPPHPELPQQEPHQEQTLQLEMPHPESQKPLHEKPLQEEPMQQKSQKQSNNNEQLPQVSNHKQPGSSQQKYYNFLEDTKQGLLKFLDLGQPITKKNDPEKPKKYHTSGYNQDRNQPTVSPQPSNEWRRNSSPDDIQKKPGPSTSSSDKFNWPNGEKIPSYEKLRQTAWEFFSYPAFQPSEPGPASTATITPKIRGVTQPQLATTMDVVSLGSSQATPLDPSVLNMAFETFSFMDISEREHQPGEPSRPRGCTVYDANMSDHIQLTPEQKIRLQIAVTQKDIPLQEALMAIAEELRSEHLKPPPADEPPIKQQYPSSSSSSTYAASTCPTSSYSSSTYPSTAYPSSTYSSSSYPASSYTSSRYPSSSYPSNLSSTYPLLSYPSPSNLSSTYPSSTYPSSTHPSSTYPSSIYPSSTYLSSSHPSSSTSDSYFSGDQVQPVQGTASQAEYGYTSQPVYVHQSQHGHRYQSQPGNSYPPQSEYGYQYQPSYGYLSTLSGNDDHFDAGFDSQSYPYTQPTAMPVPLDFSRPPTGYPQQEDLSEQMEQAELDSMAIYMFPDLNANRSSR